MRVLLVDDERTVTRTLGDSLEENGHDVTCAYNGDDASKLISEELFDCVISDIRMPGLNGIEILKQVKEKQNDTEVILITAYATVEQAVETIKIGAFDYITKPFMNDEVIMLLKKIEEIKTLKHENSNLKEKLNEKFTLDKLVGKSKKMQEVFELIRVIAKTESSVLITGESGTGKELVANAIHHNSSRKNNSFIKLSCAVFPEGLLEDELFGHVKGAFTDAKQAKKGRFYLADKGSVFLDDIDDMSLHTQVKLLRVLQEKEFEMLGSTKTIKVDVRVIAATKRDLLELVSKGLFREDLYYRLNVVPLLLPPLRKHKEDIALLTNHFIMKYGKGKKIDLSHELEVIFMEYDWPGNIRELENTIERALVFAKDKEKIFLKDLYLPDTEEEIPNNKSLLLKDVLNLYEKSHIRKVLKKTNGERNKTADILGINRKTLWEKIKYHNIDDVTNL